MSRTSMFLNVLPLHFVFSKPVLAGRIIQQVHASIFAFPTDKDRQRTLWTYHVLLLFIVKRYKCNVSLYNMPKHHRRNPQLYHHKLTVINYMVYWPGCSRMPNTCIPSSLYLRKVVDVVVLLVLYKVTQLQNIMYLRWRHYTFFASCRFKWEPRLDTSTFSPLKRSLAWSGLYSSM